jgi:hypothetical protein
MQAISRSRTAHQVFFGSQRLLHIEFTASWLREAKRHSRILQLEQRFEALPDLIPQHLRKYIARQDSKFDQQLPKRPASAIRVNQERVELARSKPPKLFQQIPEPLLKHWTLDLDDAPPDQMNRVCPSSGGSSLLDELERTRNAFSQDCTEQIPKRRLAKSTL